MKYIDVCAKAQVAAIEFAGADTSEFIPVCKDANIKVIHKSSNSKVAKRMWEKGAEPFAVSRTSSG